MGKKILFINQEITPYVPENEMSLMGKMLPQYMQERGCEIRTFMPKWGTINELRGQLHEVIRLSGINLIIDDTDHPLIIRTSSIPGSRIKVYFIDNEDYFQKHKKEDNEDCPDNGERAIFFARGVMETVKKMKWSPDIIFCLGWMSATVPLYIKTAYHDEPYFSNAKVVTCLQNKEFKSELDDNFKRCLEFRDVTIDKLTDYKDKFDFIELSKLAIDYSDGIIEGYDGANSTLIDYVRSKNIPLLSYPGEDYADAYLDFFNKVVDTAE